MHPKNIVGCLRDISVNHKKYIIILKDAFLNRIQVQISFSDAFHQLILSFNVNRYLSASDLSLVFVEGSQSGLDALPGLHEGGAAGLLPREVRQSARDDCAQKQHSVSQHLQPTKKPTNFYRLFIQRA